MTLMLFHGQAFHKLKCAEPYMYLQEFGVTFLVLGLVWTVTFVIMLAQVSVCSYHYTNY